MWWVKLLCFVLAGLLIMSIASASIGVQCSNNCAPWAKANPKSKQYMGWGVAAPVVGMVALAIITYGSFLCK